ncbi:hypothetical protein N0V82_001782 [Gnomoniopsis sp. IMI 355080]|nr:hypothetical protein N0V82_001782 [Gnomoniopsis sp. IMI 355080]
MKIVVLKRVVYLVVDGVVDDVANVVETRGDVVDEGVMAAAAGDEDEAAVAGDEDEAAMAGAEDEAAMAGDEDEAALATAALVLTATDPIGQMPPLSKKAYGLPLSGVMFPSTV